MSTRILGLDPGNEVGYALIEVSGDSLQVVDYGTIPTIQPGLDGMLWSIWRWLEENASSPDVQLVFEDFICSHRIPSSKESHEIRGVIRLFCFLHKKGTWQSLVPATIRSQLGIANKKEAKAWVEAALGFKPGGKDHIPDSFAVAMACAVRQGLWQPSISFRKEAAQIPTKRTTITSKIDPDNLTDEQLQKGLRDGTIRVGRRG
jgi:Holliday junction resolvasome RuvABC endonuclease subunit